MGLCATSVLRFLLIGITFYTDCYYIFYYSIVAIEKGKTSCVFRKVRCMGARYQALRAMKLNSRAG